LQATEIDQKVRKYNIQEEMIMTYESYKTNLIDALSKAADQNNAALKTDKQMKVNQTDMDSVCLMPHGSTIARVYYVEPLYQDYRNGQTMDQQIKDIVDDMRQHERLKMKLDLDAAKIRERAYPQLISALKNKEILKHVPYRMIGDDLAVIARITIGEGSCILTHSILQRFELSECEVLDAAIRNQEETPYTLDSLEHTVSDLVESEKVYGTENTQENGKMLVLTNLNKVYGAAEILNRRAMSEATQILNGDFFILPSSIHETLLIPVQGEDIYNLKEIVRSVNQTEVAVQDQLSDSVYYYDSHMHEVINTDHMVYRDGLLCEADKQSQHRSCHM
jgi:hypothetical protein